MLWRCVCGCASVCSCSVSYIATKTSWLKTADLFSLPILGLGSGKDPMGRGHLNLLLQLQPGVGWGWM